MDPLTMIIYALSGGMNTAQAAGGVVSRATQPLKPGDYNPFPVPPEAQAVLDSVGLPTLPQEAYYKLAPVVGENALLNFGKTLQWGLGETNWQGDSLLPESASADPNFQVGKPKYFGEIPPGVTQEDIARWSEVLGNVSPDEMKHLSEYEREFGPFGRFATKKSGEVASPNETVVPKTTAETAAPPVPKAKPKVKAKKAPNTWETIVTGLGPYAGAR